MARPDSDGENIWRPHVTVACVVHDGGRFLMVEETIRGVRVFNQPAGHLDPDESLLQAACRETLEETGWEIELDCLIGVQQWVNPANARHIVRFAFAGRPLRHYPERELDEGIVAARWMDYPEIRRHAARLRSPLVLATLDDWLAGQRLPLAALRSLPPSAGD